MKRAERTTTKKKHAYRYKSLNEFTKTTKMIDSVMLNRLFVSVHRRFRYRMEDRRERERGRISKIRKFNGPTQYI